MENVKQFQSGLIKEISKVNINRNITCLCHFDSSLIIIGLNNGELLFLFINNNNNGDIGSIGKISNHIRAHEKRVTNIIKLNENLLLTTSFDCNVYLWNIEILKNKSDNDNKRTVLCQRESMDIVLGNNNNAKETKRCEKSIMKGVMVNEKMMVGIMVMCEIGVFEIDYNFQEKNQKRKKMKYIKVIEVEFMSMILKILIMNENEIVIGGVGVYGGENKENENQKNLCLLNIKNEKFVVFIGHKGHISSLSKISEKNFVSSSTDDKCLRIWNILNGQCTTIVTKLTVVSSKLISNDYLIVGCSSLNKDEDNGIRMVDLKMCKEIENLFVKQQNPVNNLLVVDSTYVLASQQDDCFIRLFKFDLEAIRDEFKIDKKNQTGSNDHKLLFSSEGKIKYTVTDNVLGFGTFGTVFKAYYEDLKTGKKEVVAMKKIDFNVLKEKIRKENDGIEENVLNEIISQQRENAIKEIRMLENLNHENVIKNIGSEFTIDHAIMLTEYASEGTLKSVFEDIEHINDRIKLCKEKFNQVIKGVAYLHSLNILHKDIKPENIFVTNVDGKEIVKIGDIGISSVSDEKNVQLSSLTTSATLNYMPPEFKKYVNTVHEFGESSRKAKKKLNKIIPPMLDVYSLGITFIHVLTGKCRGRNFDENKNPIIPDEIKDGKLRDLLTCCLCYYPKERLPASKLLFHSYFDFK